MKNFTFFDRWIPGRNRHVQDAQTIENQARAFRNLQGFEELSEFTPGGLQMTNDILGTPFNCSPAFNVAGTKIDRVIIGAFRNGAEYNFTDWIHLDFFGAVSNTLLFDQGAAAGPEIVAVTGTGVIFYEMIWDGITASPVVTAGFAPTLPPNTDTVKHVPLAFAALGTDLNLLYLRQVQSGIIREYYHECCEGVGPEPGICPEICIDDCDSFLPISFDVAGFSGDALCEVFNGSYSLTNVLSHILSPGCWHSQMGGSSICNPPPGETIYHCPNDVPFAMFRTQTFEPGVPIFGAMCCNGLWEMHAYVADNFFANYRTARWFASPDPARNGCVPLTSDWFLESVENLPPCNTDCGFGHDPCCGSDCLQCLTGGTLVTS